MTWIPPRTVRHGVGPCFLPAAVCDLSGEVPTLRGGRGRGSAVQVGVASCGGAGSAVGWAGAVGLLAGGGSGSLAWCAGAAGGQQALSPGRGRRTPRPRAGGAGSYGGPFPRGWWGHGPFSCGRRWWGVGRVAAGMNISGDLARRPRRSPRTDRPLLINTTNLQPKATRAQIPSQRRRISQHRPNQQPTPRPTPRIHTPTRLLQHPHRRPVLPPDRPIDPIGTQRRIPAHHPRTTRPVGHLITLMQHHQTPHHIRHPLPSNRRRKPICLPEVVDDLPFELLTGSRHSGGHGGAAVLAVGLNPLQHTLHAQQGQGLKLTIQLTSELIRHRPGPAPGPPGMKDHLNRLIRMPPQPTRTRRRPALPHQHITPTSPTRREHIPHHQTNRPTP